MKEITDFIDFINGLTDELFCDDIDFVDPKFYYLNGGCFEFAKVLNHYVTDSNIVIRKDLSHCAVMIDDDVYDSLGIAFQPEEYTVADDETIEYMNQRFGIKEIKFDKKIPSEALIKEIDQCNIEELIETINNRHSKRV